MKRLKIVLRSNYLYIALSLILTAYLIFYYNNPKKIHIDLNETKYIGIITNIKIKEDKLTLEVKGKEKVICFYYYKDIKEIEKYRLGDKVLLEGSFSIPKNNTIFNLFNYKNYLKSKNIYLIFNTVGIKKINSNKNIFYKIKNNLIRHIDNYKSKAYLEAFILGNKSLINDDNINNYQSSGISHLLAISGMHVSIISLIIIFMLNSFRFRKNIILIITDLLLIFYMILIGTPSVYRSVLLFILISLNKIFNLEIKTIKLFILVLILLLFINPYYLYDIGFLYSFIISFYLIIYMSYNKFKSLIKVSFIAFLSSIPITLYYFYEVNFLSIILNIFYVPFVSFIVFPLSIITLLIPVFDNIFLLFINILEKLSSITSSITYFKLVFGRVNILFIIIYYLIFTLFIFKRNSRYLIFILILLLFQYNINYIFPKRYLIMIDVNQGDSILINNKNNIILIDTGGKINSNLSKNLISLFKSLGIRKINTLILSHGDYDHMGEAINLVNNFKVEKVIFNCGEFNELEKGLIKVLDKKKIKYYSCINKIDNLYFLQTKLYNNENDNSNVIYTEINGYKFMFMGDAGIEKEKNILEKYNISNIDVLKVGHHGSKTSSGKEFIDEINPKYSIISVGKNNRYGHPNKEVLENLEDSKIYRTDHDGSILLTFDSNLQISTCKP